MIKLLICIVIVFNSITVFATNLYKERVWAIPNNKKSIFLDEGIFHHELSNKVSAGKIISVRNSYLASRGYERIVFDFANDQLGRIYGNISQKNKKISIDFSNTEIATGAANIQNSKYISSIDFYVVENDTITAEIKLSQEASFDIFYLTAPTRLVIDIKNK
jgi:hypothetical protein